MTAPSPDLPLPQVEAESPSTAELLRYFLGAAYTVCTSINPRGYNWSEAYLDQARAAALAANIPVKVEGESVDSHELRTMIANCACNGPVHTMSVLALIAHIDSIITAQVAAAEQQAYQDAMNFCIMYIKTGEADDSYLSTDHVVTFKAALAASQAAPAKAEGCVWSLDNYDDGFTWTSSCGEAWTFIDGGPQENRVSFCHHCGGKVHIKK